MSEFDQYSVSTTGSLVDGFDSEKVTAEFSSLFKTTPDKAALYISTAKVIKKNLSHSDAERYRDTLANIGLGVAVIDSQGKVVTQATDQLEMVPVELEPVENTGPTGVMSAIEAAPVVSEADQGFRCPKCDKAQEQTEQCVACGVYVEKFNAAQGAYGMAGSTTSASGRPGGQAGKRRASVSKVDVEDDSLSVKGLCFAAIVAVAGAVVWYLIATVFGYELGFVAWGVGGAIGLAAAFGGSRSDLAGVACGVLVVLAIFGGKYMAMSSFTSEIQDYQAILSGDDSDQELLAIYEEFQYDASLFAAVDSSSDFAVKTFMVDHRFSDAETGASVGGEELEYFRTEFQPGLEKQIVTPMSFAEWQSDMFGDMEAVFQDYSTLSMVFDSLELLDIVFLLLGISTAFQLARRGRDA